MTLTVDKKVIHLIPGLETGGTENQLRLILPALQDPWQNEVVCLGSPTPIGQTLTAAGIPVHYLDSRSFLDPRLPFALFRLLRHSQPRVLVTYLIQADILGRVVGRLAHVPIIIASQRSSLFGPAYRHQIDRATRFLVTHYTAQTAATQELMHRVMKIPREKITVIPNAVALPATTVSRSSDTLIITCVANLKPEKRLDILLAAFEDIHGEYPHSELWLVGEGPERPTLLQQIQGYQSRSRIRFLGHRPAVNDILERSHIFVLPTAIEGMSNALLEAMSHSLPCLVSDIPANRAVITHRDSGLLFENGNQRELASALRRLCDAPALRERLGSAARRHIEHFHTLPVIVRQWKALLSQLS